VRAFLLAVAAVLVASACASAKPLPAAPAAPDLFALDVPALLRDEPKVARKIARSPFAYFRYTNHRFVDLVCERYGGAIAAMPVVQAHGDAHLEQYAVFAEGRGLSDFDGSALGPPVVDLARFATSLVLASANGPSSGRLAVDALVRGYVRALDDPSAVRAEPAAAARLRARFASSPRVWLDRVEKLLQPLPSDKKTTFETGWTELVPLLRARDPSLAEHPDFFKIKAEGTLDMGVGSARAEKFAARIEGPSEAPDDDLVIEAKALETGALGSCMRGAALDAKRVIQGEMQIARTPETYLAAIAIDGKPFYTHAWLVHYTELSAADVRSGAELAELAEDVGLQLGRGHANVPDPARAEELRKSLKTAIASMQPGLANTAVDLASEVTRSWNAYLSASHQVAWTRRAPRP
jgi:hypothetical protein